MNAGKPVAACLDPAATCFRMSEAERALLITHRAQFFYDWIELLLPEDEVASAHRCTKSAIIAVYRHFPALARVQRNTPAVDEREQAVVEKMDLTAHAPKRRVGIARPMPPMHQADIEDAAPEQDSRDRGCARVIVLQQLNERSWHSSMDMVDYNLLVMCWGKLPSVFASHKLEPVLNVLVIMSRSTVLSMLNSCASNRMRRRAYRNLNQACQKVMSLRYIRLVPLVQRIKVQTYMPIDQY